jgi:hypothetical protein
MRISASLLALSLTACGPDLIGDWVGTCEFNDYDVDVELEVKDISKGELEGDASAKLSFTNGNTADPIIYEGSLSGTKDKTDFTFELDMVDLQGRDVLLQIEGVLDKKKNEIEGECKSGGDDGDIELEFDG